jgi:phosphotransferase system  glucose/maltose/N-acetylglucosamine-specific IIC component
MSSFDILKDYTSVSITGFLSGLITLLFYPAFPLGEGGKRGFMACIAVHIFVYCSALLRHFQALQKERQKEQQQQKQQQRETTEGIEME